LKSVGISVHPDHWDFQKNRPKNNCPNKELMDNVITRETALFAEMISNIKKMEIEIDMMQAGNLTCIPKWLDVFR